MCYLVTFMVAILNMGGLDRVVGGEFGGIGELILNEKLDWATQQYFYKVIL